MVGKKRKQSFQSNTNSGKLPQHGGEKCQISTGKMPSFFQKVYAKNFQQESNKTGFLGAYCMIIWDDDTCQYHTLRLGAWPKLCVEMLMTLRKTTDSKVAFFGNVEVGRVSQIHGRFFMIEQWWSWCSPKQLFTPSCIEMSTRISNPKWLFLGEVHKLQLEQ